MKLRIVSLSLLALCLAAIPALAQTDLYDNGAINGTTDAWTINFGFVVSDTFNLSGSANVTGLSFGAWLAPGDVLQTAEVQITSAEFGGTTFTDQVVSFSQTGCVGNQYGFNVCTEWGNLGTSVNLAAGTYWLNLDNAVVNTGDPVYWDENSGPSQASENTVGTIPSEAFTILGGGTTTTTSTTSVPEPSSIMLFGSAILGLAGLLRRKPF